MLSANKTMHVLKDKDKPQDWVKQWRWRLREDTVSLPFRWLAVTFSWRVFIRQAVTFSWRVFIRQSRDVFCIGSIGALRSRWGRPATSTAATSGGTGGGTMPPFSGKDIKLFKDKHKNKCIQKYLYFLNPEVMLRYLTFLFCPVWSHLCPSLCGTHQIYLCLFFLFLSQSLSPSPSPVKYPKIVASNKIITPNKYQKQKHHTNPL